jgi:hypothetical protein
MSLGAYLAALGENDLDRVTRAYWDIATAMPQPGVDGKRAPDDPTR